MAETDNKRSLGKIADILKDLKQRQIPIVHENANISKIIEAFTGSTHSRLLYVVDQEKRLKGFISLGNLIRHVFFHYHEPYIDTRKLTHMAVSETARHFMQRTPHFAVASDDLQEVLQRMVKDNIKEIPIVDNEKKIVADLTIVDLLNQYKQVQGSDLL